MKTNIVLRLGIPPYRCSFMYVFILLCLAGFLNSCERGVFSYQKGNEKTSQVEPATWQEQVKYVQNRNRITTKAYNVNKPCLLSYTYKGIIDTEKN